MLEIAVDQKQFARLAGDVATMTSRRPLAAAFAVSLGAAVFGGDDGAAKPSRKKKRKKRIVKRNRREVASRCELVMSRAGCTYGPVGLVDAWTCPALANLNYQNLSGCDLHGSSMARVQLREANLQGTVLNNADLSGANLHAAKMQGASLVQARLVVADLGGASSYRADLRQANFTDASLNSVNLIGARLEGAIFQGADLRGVDWVLALVPIPSIDNVTHCPDGAQLLWPNDCCGHLNGYTTPMC